MIGTSNGNWVVNRIAKHSRKLATWLALLAGLCGALESGAGRAEIQNAPHVGTWVADGTVKAVAGTASTIYLGGQFNTMYPYTGGGVPIDARTSSPVAVYPPVVGIVYACAPDGVGGWYIGGDFNGVGGVARDNIAHIRYDGNVDPNWDANADSTVNALALSGSTLFAGGSFANIGGKSRRAIAALDVVNGAATDWNPIVIGSVEALWASGSIIYVGGSFSSVAGQTRHNIAAVDASGALLGWDPDADGGVRAIVAYGSAVYVGGDFNRIGGQTRNYIAALDGSGAATVWNPDADDTVYSLAALDYTIYAGGGFMNIGRQARHFIAALDVSGSGDASPTWNPNPNTMVFSVAVSGSTVYAGGDFSTIGGDDRQHIAELDTTNGAVLPWNPGTLSGRVWTIARAGSTVYIGGQFVGAGGAPRNHLAALDAMTGFLTNWDPNADGEVDALAAFGSTVYAAGGFGRVGGQARKCIAAIDAATGAVVPSWDASANTAIWTLALSPDGSTLYAGGDFSTIGGKDRNYIAAIDANTGLASDWNPVLDGRVWTLTTDGSTVYAGGQFSNVGSQPSSRIAAIDAGGVGKPGWTADNIVYALALSPDGSTLYAGGDFNTIGGAARKNLAALNTANGTAIANWDPSPGNRISAIAATNATVFVGGNFNKMGGQTRRCLASLDAASGAVTGWNPNGNGEVESIALSSAALYAGGGFTNVGDIARPRFAQFDLSAPPIVTIVNPARSRTVPNTTTQFAFSGMVSDADGDATVEWVFYRVRGGAWQEEAGTTNWSFTATGLVIGQNLVEVMAKDSGGVYGDAVSRTITRSEAGESLLYNISTRGQVGNGANAMFAGFIIDGDSPKTVAVTGWGPTLGDYGVSNILVDPTLSVYSGSDVIGQCDDWWTSEYKDALEGLGLGPKYHNESGAVLTLPAGAYTAILSGNGNPGFQNGIVAVWDGDTSHSQLANISTRGWVGTGADQMFAGFIVQGVPEKTVAITGWGPRLGDFGVVDFLQNPTLTVYQGSTAIGTCDDWGSSVYKDLVIAANLAPKYPAESAIVLTLEPGEYTAILSGVGGATGNAIVAVWAVE